jgi:squalene-hopene/tetraprenyl-beta-curcumene cyclase
MGLMAAVPDAANDPAIEKAMRWLAEQQREDGNWNEQFYTGTGFPKVFYHNYHLYRLYFPVTALARWQRLRAAAE